LYLYVESKTEKEKKIIEIRTMVISNRGWREGDLEEDGQKV